MASKLHLPIFVGEYNYCYDRDKFYDNFSDRKTHKPIIKDLGCIKKNNYHLLMIDDSILTGHTLEASVDQLRWIAKQITFFGVADLKTQKLSEKELNDYSYKEGGLEFLLKLLKSKNYIPTSHFIRTVETLDGKERVWLLENLNAKQKAIFMKAYYIYTNCPL